jgi:nitroreductase
MDVFEAIRNRRSIRRYRTDPVDEKTVQAVLEAAHWAPSWGNTQCWRFIVVRDQRTKTQIADTLLREIIDNESVKNAATGAINQAPVLIVVCAEQGQAGCRPAGVQVTDKGVYWYMFDIALAVENLTLAAHALGLGTVIIGGFDAPEVAKILEIPNDYCVVTMTPLGVPDHKGQVSPRKQLSEVLCQEKFVR